MYKDFYQMNVEAFGNLPLLKFYFHSKSHKMVWHYLLNGIASREQFLLVMGDYGVGKTTLCLALVRVFKKKTDLPFIYLSTPNYGYSKILLEVARRLEIPIQEEEESGLHASIFQYFKDQRKRRSFYIIMDDAHDLAISSLNKLRSLANFNHDGFFPFHIIFFAHPSFADMLTSRTLIPLDQRIKRKAHLEPLDYSEMREYIFARLFKSGAPGIPAFTEDALQKIYSYSRGIPRLINNICDSSLLLGASERLTVIDAPLVTETIKSMPGGPIKRVTEGSPAIPSQEERPSGLEKGAEAPKEEILKEEKAPRTLSLSGIDQEMKAPRKEKAERRGKKKIPLLRVIIIFALFVLLFLAGTYLLRSFWGYGKSILSGIESPKKTTSREEIFRDPSKDVKKEDTAKAQKDVPVPKEEPPSSQKEPGHQRELSTGVLSTPENKIAPVIPKDEGTSLYPWSLHLGSYRSLEKAKEGLSDLIRRGISPYIVKVDLGNKGMWWRVFSGYYKSEEEAQHVKKEFSLSDAVIAKTIYANYIGAFPSQTEMAVMASRLEKLGYYAYSINRSNGKSHLYTGAFTKKDEALAQNENLLADGIQSDVVRR